VCVCVCVCWWGGVTVTGVLTQGLIVARQRLLLWDRVLCSCLGSAWDHDPSIMAPVIAGITRGYTTISDLVVEIVPC
jgi:hypothetical protein